MFCEAPGHGCGQGNGGGPTFWVLISTPLVKALREGGFGMDFQGVLSYHPVVFVVHAFLDNMDLIETTKNHQDDF